MSPSTSTRVLIAGLALTGAGLAGVGVYEGYRSRAYDDGVGVQTIGFGSTTRPDGSAVQRGDVTTPERALVRLADDAGRIERAMKACLPSDLRLHPWEWDAFVSLAYNVGPGAFCGSTLVKKLKQTPPDYAGACDEILRWTRAGGRVLTGLVKRRQAEHRLCREGVPMARTWMEQGGSR